MTVQSETNAFIAQLARRVGEVAIPELFDGYPKKGVGKLAVDYVLPVIWNKDRYDLYLVAKIKHSTGETTATVAVKAQGRYTPEAVLVGPKNWLIPIEAIVQPLVSAMRQGIQPLVNPHYMYIRRGDYWQAEVGTNRKWVS